MVRTVAPFGEPYFGARPLATGYNHLRCDKHMPLCGHRNRATLAVARKLVTYLLAVDKNGQSFQLRALGPDDQAEKEGTQKIKTA